MRKFDRPTALIIVLLTAALLSGRAAAESDFMKQFRADYAALDMDLLNNTGEKAKIKDFVYEKDVATFTFKEGTVHLLRYVGGRPTTAIFVGRGHARIEVPSHVERMALKGVTKDSLVNEDFEVAFIRMADDFDLKLKERFEFEETELKWRTFTIVKQAQGEQFFKPIITHTYDAFFQLLRSHYERAGDGFFWMDFNRYVFSFDPNRPEQVAIDHEQGVGDLEATEAAAFQRKETGISDDGEMSRINFPTTMLEMQGKIVLGGIDGFALDTAALSIKVLVNADSLKFVSLFLPAILTEDSIHFEGRPVDYHRRNDFSFIGAILPEYRYRGDTLDFAMWFHGKNFDRCLPWVENPQVCPHLLSFTVPRGFNYYLPGMSSIENLDARRDHFTIAPSNQYRNFYFHVYASDIDTIPVASDAGIMLNFLKSGHLSMRLMTCWVPDETFQTSIVDAFNFLAGTMGPPPNAFYEYIVPERTESMPGLIMTPQTSCAMEGPQTTVGGFDVQAGTAVARQWFGSLMRPASDREAWVAEALPHYLGLMFIHSKQGATYQANLLSRRDTVCTEVERQRDMPLAVGSRDGESILENKGVWLVHMLRFLMYDLETQSESSFHRFLQELAIMCNTRTFTNTDFISLAQKHYGQPLDWFFKQWLYGHNLPEFKVEYRFSERDGGHYVDVKVETEKVPADFRMPVAMQVVDGNGDRTFLRETISAPQTEFALGPFDKPPQEFVFNEFYSVLSKDRVKAK
jgi:hypothetical protein